MGPFSRKQEVVTEVGGLLARGLHAHSGLLSSVQTLCPPGRGNSRP